MELDRKLTQLLKGRTIQSESGDEGHVAITFDDQSTLKLKVAGQATVSVGAKVEAAHEAGDHFQVDLEDGLQRAGTACRFGIVGGVARQKRRGPIPRSFCTAGDEMATLRPRGANRTHPVNRIRPSSTVLAVEELFGATCRFWSRPTRRSQICKGEIIGYDEDPGGLPEVFGFGHPPGAPALEPGDRGGSHNLVIGSGNRFTQSAFGGLVAGYLNTISNSAASVSGGSSNVASGFVANVSGGQFNQASGTLCSVSGGYGNSASIFAASVSGGLFGTASNFFASVLGGQHNTASQEASVVLGGENNTADGFESVVIGGKNVTDNNNTASIAPQPPFP